MSKQYFAPYSHVENTLPYEGEMPKPKKKKFWKYVGLLFVFLLVSAVILNTLIIYGYEPSAKTMYAIGKYAPYITYTAAHLSLPVNFVKAREFSEMMTQHKNDPDYGLRFGENMVKVAVGGFSGTPLAPKGEADGFLKEIKYNKWTKTYSVVMILGGWSEFSYGPFRTLINEDTQKPFTPEEIDLLNKKSRGWLVSMTWVPGTASLNTTLLDPYYSKGEIPFRFIKRINIPE